MKPLYIFVIIIISFIGSCAQTLSVTVVEKGRGLYTITVQKSIFQSACIKEVSIINNGKKVWKITSIPYEQICIDSFNFPVTPNGFQSIIDKKPFRKGHYYISIFSDDAVGTGQFYIK